MKKYISLIITGILIFSCINRSKNVKNNEGEDLFPVLYFFQKVSDFGHVPIDTVLIARYYFKNEGNDTLHINRISPDCACTSYYLSNNNILPDDTAFIDLEFNTNNKYGEEKVFAIVEANTEAKMYKLTLKADVH